MKLRTLLVGAAIVAAALVVYRLWPEDTTGRPLVCAQLSPGVKHAKHCTPAELDRVRAAHRWVAQNVAPALSPVVMAGVSSFVEDTGRRTKSTFYRRLNRNDIDGACEAMLTYVHRRGEIDPERVKRREYERAMCLTKG
ncbi:lysozyme [Comamonas sp. C24C]